MASDSDLALTDRNMNPSLLELYCNCTICNKSKQHIGDFTCIIFCLQCLFRSECQIPPGSHSSLPFLTTLWESLNELDICVCMDMQACVSS